MLSYDRRAPAGLMDALCPPRGWASSLVEYGRTQPLDLQLRGYSGKQTKATLYVGLTKVVDLHYRETKTGPRVRLDADKSYRTKTNRWRGTWETSQPAEELAEDWTAVEDYIE